MAYHTKLNGQFKLCAWETQPGYKRPYLCSHHEYCCALGCCVSSAFSFYQLWYFWLLLLLIILLCSGGGWWFRFRNGGWSRENSPAVIRNRRHRRRAGHGGAGARTLPHHHPYYQNDYTLPPGYDKDPPTYDEVISHLNQFPKIDDLRANGPGASVERPADVDPSIAGPSVSQASGDPAGTLQQGAPRISPTAPEPTDCHLPVPPPPSYEMVLDLKRREVLVQDIEEEENETGSEASIHSTRERIRNLLGRMKPGRTMDSSAHGQNLSGSAASTSNTPSPSTASSGLFTISRESLPSLEDYERQRPPEMHLLPPPEQPPPPPPLSPAFEDVEDSTSSHSDYSSSFISSPSGSRSLPESPAQTPEATTDPRDHNSPSVPSASVTLEHSELTGGSRPCTGRSTLSRPTTSISARTLPAPSELARKTSIPGAVLEMEDDGTVTIPQLNVAT